MKSFFKKCKLLILDPDIRLKIISVLGLFVLFRLLANIPVPGVNTAQLAQYLNGNQFLGLLNVFAGGGLTQLSLVMLGVSPYITSSIILQLLTSLFPKLKTMYQEEGQAGREKFYRLSQNKKCTLDNLWNFPDRTHRVERGRITKMKAKIKLNG